MSLEGLDHLVYVIMRIGTVIFTIVIETTFVVWVALIAAGALKRSWRRFQHEDDSEEVAK